MNKSFLNQYILDRLVYQFCDILVLFALFQNICSQDYTLQVSKLLTNTLYINNKTVKNL